MNKLAIQSIVLDSIRCDIDDFIGVRLQCSSLDEKVTVSLGDIILKGEVRWGKGEFEVNVPFSDLREKLNSCQFNNIDSSWWLSYDNEWKSSSDGEFFWESINDNEDADATIPASRSNISNGNISNLFQEFEGWDIDNSSARLVIMSLKGNINNLDEEELLGYYGLTDGEDGEIQSYMYSDSIEGLISSQELGLNVFKNEIPTAKKFLDQLLKFNFDHLWFIDDDGIKFISEIGQEDISLIERNYSMFEYAIVCEVCHVAEDDY